MVRVWLTAPAGLLVPASGRRATGAPPVSSARDGVLFFGDPFFLDLPFIRKQEMKGRRCETGRNPCWLPVGALPSARFSPICPSVAGIAPRWSRFSTAFGQWGGGVERFAEAIKGRLCFPSSCFFLHYSIKSLVKKTLLHIRRFYFSLLTEY